MRGMIAIKMKSRFFNIRTPNLRRIDARVFDTWSIIISIWVMTYSKLGKLYATSRLSKLLHCGANSQFIVAFAVYFSHTQSWTHCSRGYLVHGPWFYLYAYMKYSTLNTVHVTAILSKLLHLESWLQFRESLGYLLFTPPHFDPQLRKLFDTWTTLLSLCMLKYSKLGKIGATLRLFKPQCHEGWLSFYWGLWSLPFAHPIFIL